MSFNRYLYCDASPVDSVDPSGLEIIWYYGHPCNQDDAPKPLKWVGTAIGAGVGMWIPGGDITTAVTSAIGYDEIGGIWCDWKYFDADKANINSPFVINTRWHAEVGDLEA
jgi:hypothetical protein